MIKRLTRHGNSYALIIDKAILELLGISPQSPLELSTDGRSLQVRRIDEPVVREPPRRGTRPTLRTIRRHRDAILEIAERHGARDVRVFGSVARGSARSGSDVDFLVKMDQDRSLMDRAAMMQEIEALLGCKVDIVNERALNRLIRDGVLEEGIPL
jgi:predicted nucleotidyltransferase